MLAQRVDGAARPRARRVGTGQRRNVRFGDRDRPGGPAHRHHWWLAVAVPAWVAAMCIYGLMTWLILWRAVTERQDRDGFEPDTWILMGGLAIATLAGDNIHAVAPGWLAGPVRAGDRRDLGGGHAVDTAADLLRPAPDQPAARHAALRRRVVGVRVPAGHVLRGQLRHGGRTRSAVAAARFRWCSSGTRWRRGSIVVVAGLLLVRAAQLRAARANRDAGRP